MKIFNTLKKATIEFKPLHDDSVSYYTCGPTVYDQAHIGNLRTYIFEDLLKRTLGLAGYKVKHVMNITDVDDKTIKKGEGRKSKHQEITEHFEKVFMADLARLNIIAPDKITRATEYIAPMVKLVETLLAKGFAYKTDDGSIYFAIDKFDDYGKLSNLDRNGLKNGARVAQDSYDKENPADFALWKAWSESDGEIYWQTSLGKGRPGWHIECSAMSQCELGQTIDIHAGGIDLVFPHHENEIAQSEAASGNEFARYWVHGEHLLVDGQKMSKSLNNFYTLDNIVDQGFDPLDFRYLCLAAHYRSKMNFTWGALESARNARQRLKRISEEILNSESAILNKYDMQNSKYLKLFEDKLFDDLNMPEALAVLWEIMRDEKVGLDEKMSVLKTLDEEILGLGLFKNEQIEIPKEVQELFEQRNSAKAEKNYEKADELRQKISNLGWEIEDTAAGPRIIKK